MAVTKSCKARISQHGKTVQEKLFMGANIRVFVRFTVVHYFGNEKKFKQHGKALVFNSSKKVVIHMYDLLMHIFHPQKHISVDNVNRNILLCIIQYQ